MLKRTLQAPPQESGAINGYTSELSRLLRPALPGERADEIITEAQAHLYDRAGAIAADENLPQVEAEARAVAAFTPAVQFAREMARSAFETGHSKAWRTMGGALALAYLCGILASIVLNEGFNAPITSGSPIIGGVNTLVLLVLCVCSFQARRAQTRRFALWSALAAVSVFFYTGFFYLDGAPTDEEWTQGSRASIQSYYNWRHSERLSSEQHVQRLQTYIKLFQQPNPVIPAELKGEDGTGYIVPCHYLVPNSFQTGRDTPKTVATLAEARAEWQSKGPNLLFTTKANYNGHLHYEEPLRIALQQTGFAKTAWWYALVTAGFGAWLVTLDWIFAKLGRAVFAKRRTQRIKPA